MSPLLACATLAALCATATALWSAAGVIPPTCAIKEFGRKTNHTYEFPRYIPCPDGKLMIPETCPRPLRRVGQTILACLNSAASQAPPTIHDQPPYHKYTPIRVTCPHVEYESDYSTIYVTEYCGYPDSMDGIPLLNSLNYDI
ncbi:uncharacterized protein LOC133532787 [Cydia pomonella]|uniref:uncharacterized protein LOC133532787 n=1 Tax=Cydia pomonella TaxID=82600 RepID=UPI002ADD9E8D|nr:uncharacterized protein LOC133532787 [Cydia pomonella]